MPSKRIDIGSRPVASTDTGVPKKIFERVQGRPSPKRMSKTLLPMERSEWIVGLSSEISARSSLKKSGIVFKSDPQEFEEYWKVVN